MKKSTKKLLLTIFSTVILVACLAITSFAANSDVSFRANADDENTVIATQTGRNGKTYLFLPSSAEQGDTQSQAVKSKSCKYWP